MNKLKHFFPSYFISANTTNGFGSTVACGFNPTEISSMVFAGSGTITGTVINTFVPAAPALICAFTVNSN